MTAARYLVALPAGAGITFVLLVLIGSLIRTGDRLPAIAPAQTSISLVDDAAPPAAFAAARGETTPERRPSRPESVPLPVLPLDDPGVPALANDAIATAAPGAQRAPRSPSRVPTPRPDIVPQPSFPPADGTAPAGGAAAGADRTAPAAADSLALLRVIRQARPRYPANARRNGVEGFVDIEFRVAKNGRVIEPKILSSFPQGAFEEAALKAVRDWEFGFAAPHKAATTDPVRMRIKFELTDP